MSVIARGYISFVIFAGGAVLLSELSHAAAPNLLRYLCYLTLAAGFSQLRISIPSIVGGMSVYYVYVFFGVLEFSVAETLLMGCTATLFQSLNHDRGRPTWYYLLFNTCNMAVAISLTFYAYHSPWLGQRNLDTALMLVLMSILFFAVNTFPTAAVISLTEKRSVRKVWQDGYFWSFPYYLLAAALAGITSLLDRAVGWQTGLLVLPLVYLAWRSYSMSLERLEDGKKHAEEMASLHLRTIEALALAIEA